MAVKDGRLVLPDGMSYRVLVLPETARMTPALLRKVKELVAAGATVVGPVRPAGSPGLAGYPKCDAEVRELAGELWGKGKVLTGRSPEQVLAGLGVGPDFSAPPFIRWIHRSAGDTEIYFVASRNPQPTDVTCSFRVTGRLPEFWRPETGRIEPVAVYEQARGTTRIPVHFEPSGSVFVVFRKGAGAFDPVVSVARDGRTIAPAPEPKGRIVVDKAVYGVLDDPKRSRDVRVKVQAILDSGETRLQVGSLAEGDDPAFGVVKTLIVDYRADGKSLQARGKDPETVELPRRPGRRASGRGPAG